MLTRCSAVPEKRKAFKKRVIETRKKDLGKVHDMFKKVASDEVLRVQDLFKDHVDFFKEDPVEPETFIVKQVQED